MDREINKQFAEESALQLESADLQIRAGSLLARVLREVWKQGQSFDLRSRSLLGISSSKLLHFQVRHVGLIASLDSGGLPKRFVLSPRRTRVIDMNDEAIKAAEILARVRTKRPLIHNITNLDRK